MEFKNTGDESSMYNVALGSCNHSVVAVSSQTVTVGSGATEDVLFEVLDYSALD